MMRCGLLGEKLGHSYSPRIHRGLCNYSYDLFEVPPEALGEFLTGENYTGLNVTIPYKKAVIPYCSELTPIARRLGAVNTIIRKEDGLLIGHNTDYFGFLSMVHRSGLDVKGKKVLVLGTGGASATAVAVLEELKAHVIIISRTGVNNYHNVYNHCDAAVIVNTTPVGMFPDVGVSPISLDQFPSLEGVLDVIYNPAKTKLLLDAEARGLVIENGLWMLVAQAKESAQWFTGELIEDQIIGEIHHKLRSQMENTILIGMPGCGKTTIGCLLAQETGKQFVDSDLVISQQSGKSIPDLFHQCGEAGFRALESKVLAQLGAQSGLVIATGGGCVTQPENYPILHQNGRIIWLQRDLSALPTDGRPLSQAGSLADMYRTRRPMYERFADATVMNHTDPEDTVQLIVNLEGTL